MALRNLFNRARSFGNSREGRRLFSQGKEAWRQRGTKGQGGQGRRRQSGSIGIMGLAERFLGRGGPGGTTRRR